MRRRRRTRSRGGGWIFWIALLFSSAAIAAGLVVWGLPRLAERWLERQAAAWEGPGAAFTVARISPWYVRLDDVVLTEELWIARADHISVDFLPWHVIRGRAGSVTVRGLDIVYTLDALPELDPDRERLPVEFTLPALPFELLLVRDATVRLISDGEEWSFPFSADARARGGERWEATAEITGEDLSVHGFAKWDSRNQTADLSATFRTADIRIWIDRMQRLLPAYGAETFAIVQERAPLSFDAFARVEQGRFEGWSVVADGGRMDLKHGDVAGVVRKWALGVRQASGRALEVLFSGEVDHLHAGGVDLRNFRFTAETLEAPGEWSVALSRVDWSWEDSLRGHGAVEIAVALDDGGAPVDFDMRGRWQRMNWNDTAFLPTVFTVSGTPERVALRVDMLQVFGAPWWQAKDLVSILELPPNGEIRGELRGEVTFYSDQTAVPFGFVVNAEGESIDALRLDATVFNRDGQFAWEAADWSGHVDGGILLGSSGTPEQLSGRAEFAMRGFTLSGDALRFETDRLEGEFSVAGHRTEDWAALARAAPQFGLDAWNAQLPGIVEQLRIDSIGGTVRAGDIPLQWERLRLSGDSGGGEALDLVLQVDRGVSAEHEVPALRIEARLGGDRIDLQAAGMYSAEQLPFAVRGQWSMAESSAFEGSVGPVSLDASRLLAMLNPDLEEWLLSGDFSAHFLGGHSAGEEAEIAGTISLHDGSLVSEEPDVRADGISFAWDLVWRDGVLSTDGLQELRFARLSAGDQELSDFLIAVSLAGPDQIRVEELSFQWGGGEWSAVPFDFGPEALEAALVFTVIGLELSQMTMLFPEFGVEADGLLDGVLGLAVRGDTVELRPGYLEMRRESPGRISYHNPGWLTARAGTAPRGAQATGLRAAEEAFSNLELRYLRFDFLHPSFAHPIRIAVDGKGYSSSLQAEAPVSTTVRVDYDTALLARFPLWRFITLFQSVRFEID